MTGYDFTRYSGANGNNYTAFANVVQDYKAALKSLDPLKKIKGFEWKFGDESYVNTENEPKGNVGWKSFVEECISDKDKLSVYYRTNKLFRITETFVYGVVEYFKHRNSPLSKEDVATLRNYAGDVLIRRKTLNDFLVKKGAPDSDASLMSTSLCIAKDCFTKFIEKIENGVNSYVNTRKLCVDSVKKFKKEMAKSLKIPILGLIKNKPFLAEVNRLPDKFDSEEILSVRKWAIDSINRIDPSDYIQKNSKALRSVQDLQEKYTKMLEK